MTYPTVSIEDNDLRAAQLAEISYEWHGRRYRQFLGPNDIISGRDHIEGRLREMTAAYLVWRDGNRCAIGSVLCTIGENAFSKPSGADFDHIDGDHHNHRLRNLRLACHSCNSHLQWKQKIRPRPTTSQLRERENKEGMLTESQKEQAPAEVRINLGNYPVFCRWLSDKMDMEKRITVKDAIGGGAKFMRKQTGHGSPQSARNYLDMETSSEGGYDIIEGWVQRRVADKQPMIPEPPTNVG